MSQEEFGQQTTRTNASEYNALVFVVRQLINKLATVTLVKVVAVSNSGGVEPVGIVDVQPLVNQMSGKQEATPHGVIYGIPYFRLQGGTDAVILDPKVNDIGMCAFCSRDISAVKSAKAAANPGSRRVYDWADGLYLGGFLNGTPEQYVQFTTEGITLLSPNKITLQAPEIDLKGNVVQTDGDVTMSQKLDVTGDVTMLATLDVTGIIHSGTDVLSDTISGKTHTHPDPQGGNTGPPNP